MIELYSGNSPNSQKVHIALEELQLPYRSNAVSLRAGEHRRPEFLRLNPNGKVPVLVDPEGPDGLPLTLFESGAMLLYLADKAGALMPAEPSRRWQAVQWMMFQMSAIGPMMGQLGHFTFSAPTPQPYAAEHFFVEVERLFGVLNGALEEREFLVGEYSVVDIACYPWVAKHERLGVDMEELPALTAWFAKVGERPAVRRGMALLA